MNSPTPNDLADELEKGHVLSRATTTPSSPPKANGFFNQFRTSDLSAPRSWISTKSQTMPKQAHRKRLGEKIRVRALEEYPKGFSKVGAYLNSDDNFMIYRRFGYLFSRLLLNKQDELVELEEMLEGMDNRDSRSEEDATYLMSHLSDDDRDAVGGQPTRADLLRDIEQKALEYSTLLQHAQTLVAMNRPSHQDYSSVVNFMEHDGGHLYETEGRFIYEKEDLITLRPGRESAWLDAVVEKIIIKFHCRALRYIFCTEETRRKTTDPNIHYFSRERIAAFVTLLVTLIILILLVAPIYILYHLTTQGISDLICIGVLLLFTLLFSAMASLFTKAKRHEILGAAAGYGDEDHFFRGR